MISLISMSGWIHLLLVKITSWCVKLLQRLPCLFKLSKENAARIDIYGNEVDVVTQEQAKYAYQRYQERYNKKKNLEKE